MAQIYENGQWRETRESHIASLEAERDRLRSENNILKDENAELMRRHLHANKALRESDRLRFEVEQLHFQLNATKRREEILEERLKTANERAARSKTEPPKTAPHTGPGDWARQHQQNQQNPCSDPEDFKPPHRHADQSFYDFFREVMNDTNSGAGGYPRRPEPRVNVPPPKPKFTPVTMTAAMFLSQHCDIATDDILEKAGQCKEAYRQAARKLHPDAGGSHEKFIELRRHYDVLRRHLGIK